MPKIRIYAPKCRKTPAERFWAEKKINKKGDNECWIWKGAKNKKGYGLFRVGEKTVYAHRFAYESANKKKISENMIVTQTCNNHSCVNPNHLRLGRKPKWSIAKHEVISHYLNSKLKGREVLQLRGDYKAGMSIQELAKQYKLSERQVKRNIRGVSWRFLPEV